MFNIANAMKTQSVKYNLTQITPPYAENQGVVRECFDLGVFLSLDISEDNEKQVGMLASLSFFIFRTHLSFLNKLLYRNKIIPK